MPYKIFCFIPGDHSTFAVKIDGDEDVNDLKDKIKAKKHPTLTHVAADELTLYHVNIEFDESGKHITRANEVFQDLSQHTPLREWHTLSGIEKGFPKGFTHILVQLLPSESIHSRACGAVAETLMVLMPGSKRR